MPMHRVTLTENQLAEKKARELLELLENVSADGRLSDDEVVRMDSWLKQANDSRFPAFTFLRSVISDVLSDRIIIDGERKTVISAILRIMPKENCDMAKVRFGEAASRERIGKSFELVENEEESQPSDEQLAYLRALGVRLPENCSKADASELIDRSLGTLQTVTNRQQMVLRFWDKMNLASSGRSAVGEWLDSWYAENPDRLAAWELWKHENGDCGRQDSPARVIVGEGERYLERVRSNIEHPVEQSRGSVGLIACIVAVFLAAIVILAAAL